MVEHGDNGVNLAGVKGPGGVATGAVAALAASADVVPGAIVGGEPKGVEDLIIAGVGPAEPGDYGPLLLVRWE
jgi:hypothetical protein